METTLKRIAENIAKRKTYKTATCSRLEWSEMEYCNYQFETGIAYLADYIPNDKEGQEMLIRSRIFWNWWKNHWNQRDQMFLKRGDLVEDKELARLVYYEINDAKTLAKAIYPNGVVLEMTYSEMIQELFDTKIHTL